MFPAARPLEPRQHALDAPADDHGMRTGTRSQARSTQFGLHAATPQRTARTARYRIQRRIIGTRFVNQLRIRVVARISVEHAITISQDDQQIGLDQVGNQRRQCVVVAKTDLVGDHCVVFVDDRHHPKLDQRTQGATGIQVAFAVRQVVVGQQDLRGMPAMLGKTRLPRLHQPHLTDCSGSLEARALHWVAPSSQGDSYRQQQPRKKPAPARRLLHAAPPSALPTHPWRCDPGPCHPRSARHCQSSQPSAGRPSLCCASSSNLSQRVFKFKIQKRR